MRRKQLSFYVTIKGITIRLKNVSLRTISHLADQLAGLENADTLKIMITPVTQHCDYQSEDEVIFMTIVEKLLTCNTAHKNESLPIDLAITAIREEFPDFYIKRDSNTIVTVKSKKDGSKKFRVFAGLLNDIVLRDESSARPVIIRFTTIDELIKHMKFIELQTSGIEEI